LDKAAALRGKDFYQGLFDALVLGMGAAKGYLFDHGPRVAVQAHLIGQRIGLDEHGLAEVFFGAVLADLGMIGLVEDEWEIPVPVLSAAARAEVNQHPQRSAFAASTIPLLEDIGKVIRHHHEWWDGSGYPDGLAGKDIPVGARVLRLADTVTALAEPRPHRPRRSEEDVVRIIEEGSGTEFDPELARIWLALHESGDLPSVPSVLYRQIRQTAVDTLLFKAGDTEPDGAILLELLASLIDAKDPYTGGHSRRVARLAQEVAATLGLGEEEREHARAAGYLHDLGKLAVPSRVLRKAEKLDEAEFEQIRRHANDGAELLRDIPVLGEFVAACRYHHERWDGLGYPEGISGELIPQDARILAVCDAYDAMTSARAYRSARSHEDAIAEVRMHSGDQFSPVEAEAFLSLPRELFDEMRRLRQEDVDPLLGEPARRG
jgi:putative nucleotidyltransferase with HDIG domain